MDLQKIISELRLELKDIDQAIRSLERLAVSHPTENRPQKEDEERTAAKTILLLEDGSAVLNLFLGMLTKYTILRAANAQEALQLFVDQDGRIDLFVADVTVPANSSIQMAVLLRSKRRSLPVILITPVPVRGFSEEDSRALERLGSRLVTILQKPFPAQAFSTAVSDLTDAPAVGKARARVAGRHSGDPTTV